ncbi:hypothetical protein MMC18_008515 [Xylographa bjoerkii]|nr:hypothetical protein [Xylographa bjoerkii]
MDSDSPVTQSPRTPRNKNKAHKTKAPAYTPEQRAFIRVACLEASTASKVQERFNEKYPENPKELWDIKKERAKVIQGKQILELGREAAASLELGKEISLPPHIKKNIKMEEARVRNRLWKKEFKARQSGLLVPKTPPRTDECLDDSSENLEAFIRELDMESEDDYERMEVAIKVERDEKHDEGEIGSDGVLKEDTA